jgi:phage terminase large subunit
MVAVSTIPAPPKSYTPYGAVRSVWSCKAKRVLCDGPAGTGKTRGILEKVSLAARKYPGARFLMVRKTRASMTESVLVTLERHVLVDSAGDPEPWVTPMQRRTRHSYVLPNGSEIVVGGMDNSDRILSSEYDVIVFFEATESTESDLDTLTTRLRNGVHKTTFWERGQAIVALAERLRSAQQAEPARPELAQ